MEADADRISSGSTEKTAVTGGDIENTSQGIFLPMAILMISVLIVLGWNLYLTRSQSAVWNKQFAGREQAVLQARTIQSDLQKIAADLISLSPTDSDARMIIDKYQIKQDQKKSDPPGAGL